MSDRNARIGVIGTGWWAATQHIPSLKACPDAELVALADTNREKLRDAADYFDVSRNYLDHRELVTDDHVDGVIIAVPHAHHYAVARDALRAGKHVLVEKPMALRAVDAWDLVSLAHERGLHLTVGYTQHHTAHAQRAAEIMRMGRLGELRFISALFTNSVERIIRPSPAIAERARRFPPEDPEPETYSDPALAGGGLGQTQLTHPMGLVFWLTGARATEVSALMEGFDLPVDLADAITYRLDNGAIGVMGGSGTVVEGQPRHQELRYYGSAGMLVHDLHAGRLAFYGNDGTSDQPPDLIGDDALPKHAPARAFVDLILGNGPNLAPAEAGAACVEFLEAAYQSAAERRSVAVAELLAPTTQLRRGMT